MRTSLCLALVSVLVLPACGGGDSDDDGDDTPTIDAPVGPTADSPPGTPDAPPVVPDADPLAPDAMPGFACLGNPIPTTAPATVNISGDVAEVTTGGEVLKSGVTVEAFRTGNPTPVDSDVSAATTGAYTLAIATQPPMTPADGYLRADPGMNCQTITGGADECKTVFLFPPTLIFEDIQVAPVRTVGNQAFGFLHTLAGATAPVAGTSAIAIVVTDCDGNPLAGATVTSNPAGEVRYNAASGLPNSGATATAADGVAYVLNVATGNVTVDAMYMGMDLREHTIPTRAHDGADNAINTTTIQP